MKCKKQLQELMDNLLILQYFEPVKKTGILYAMLAAFLFGASTPISKLLLKETDPWLVAGILYFGSGAGLFILFLFSGFRKNIDRNLLKRKDWPWMAGAILFGGMLGPVALMSGLASTAAASSSLLLNLEGVLTSLIAWFVFKENFDRKILAGMALILCGSIMLSWNGMPEWSSLKGPVLISAACLFWAIDNNLTRNISTSNPLQIAMIKSLVAGSTNIVLAKSLGISFSGLSSFLTISLVGFLGYGLSLLCFILALRHVGAARTGAYFSLAPFVGTILSVILNPSEFSLRLLFAGILMGIGIWIHITEKHEHEHEHEEMGHTHEHVHDEHHRHAHVPGMPIGEPHTHFHRHERLRHSHPHYPDIHHKHAH